MLSIQIVCIKCGKCVETCKFGAIEKKLGRRNRLMNKFRLNIDGKEVNRTSGPDDS